MSKEHIVKSISTLFSISTLDCLRMCGLCAHSGFQPAAPLPRKRTRMPDSAEIGSPASDTADPVLAVAQPPSAARAVDEARKFLRVMVFFILGIILYPRRR